MDLKIMIMTAVAATAALAAFGLGGSQHPVEAAKPLTEPAGSAKLVVAGGCFWCVESQMERLKGVYFVESGYAGGMRPGVTYEEVCSGQTGHAEAVKIVFDPKVISEDDLLRIFFVAHDPTQLNRQGPDVGTQYRSAIFYSSEVEKALAEKIRKEITDRKIFDRPIVTTIEPLKNYTRAEEYHQNYFEKFERATPAQKMSMNAGYCSAVVAPKVAKFRKEFADRLKKD